MLESLEIRNYALIDNLNISFQKGFNVITGETGAGKSIILKALGLILGEKADLQAVRKGADTMTISAVFSVPEGHRVEKWLDERGMDTEDGQIFIRRIIRANGSRGSFFLQNQISSRKDITDFSALLIDLHGQSEHQSLLKKENQRKILDNWCHNDALLATVETKWKEKLQNEKEKDSLEQTIQQAEKQKDYLSFSVEEIEKVHPKIGEDDKVEKELNVITKFEEIFESLSLAAEDLKNCKGEMYDALSACRKALNADSSLEETTGRLEQARIETEDIYEIIRDKVSSMSFSQEKLDNLQERYALLQRLKKKYGPSLDHVLQNLEESKQSLDSINNFEDKKKALEKQQKETDDALKVACYKLTVARNKGALILQKSIEEKLRLLGMEHAVFTIKINKSSFSCEGADDISFCLAANPGEESGAISSIASGGELSRVMLAIKTVLAEVDNMETQVFDEIDSGIGGAVALEVGEQLVKLSENTQVVAITHLASIASRADRHLVVEKTFMNGRTFTKMRQVEGKEQAEEIARMLSGEVNEESLHHAKTLLSR